MEFVQLFGAGLQHGIGEAERLEYPVGQHVALHIHHAGEQVVVRTDATLVRPVLLRLLARVLEDAGGALGFPHHGHGRERQRRLRTFVRGLLAHCDLLHQLANRLVGGPELHQRALGRSSAWLVATLIENPQEQVLGADVPAVQVQGQLQGALQDEVHLGVDPRPTPLAFPETA